MLKISTLFHNTFPLIGCINPRIVYKNVVLPEPDLPLIKRVSPCFKDIFIPSNRVSSRPILKLFTTKELGFEISTSDPLFMGFISRNKFGLYFIN